MNLDFIKQKLDTLQGKNKQSAKFWKPTEGESRVRILPYKFNPENPFIELKFYYYRQANGAAKTYLSPSVVGNPDPVLEFCDKLKATGTKENWLLARSYEPKLRTYVPVIVRGKEEEGVKFWGFGKQVYEEILKKMSNPDIGDITDLANGNDLIIQFTKPTGGQKYPKTDVDVRIKKTPAIDPTKSELIEKIADQTDIMTLFTEPTYDELKKAFENHINPDLEPDTDPDGTPTDDSDDTSPNDVSDTVDSNVPVSSVSTSATSASTPVTDGSTSVAPTPVASVEDVKARFKKMFADTK